jgi:predicted Zn-dependent protease
MGWFKKLIGKASPEESAQRVADGVVLARRGKSEQALSAYQEAIRLDPGNGVAHLNAALAQQDIFNRDLENFDEDTQKQKLLEIQQSLDKALELAPESHIAWRVAAYVARKQGHVVDALEAFERTLDFAPEGFEHRDEVEQALEQVRPLAERERVLRRAMDVAACNDVVPEESEEALAELEPHLDAGEAKSDWFWAAGVLSRHVGDAERAKIFCALLGVGKTPLPRPSGTGDLVHARRTARPGPASLFGGVSRGPIESGAGLQCRCLFSGDGGFGSGGRISSFGAGHGAQRPDYQPSHRNVECTTPGSRLPMTAWA